MRTTLNIDDDLLKSASVFNRHQGKKTALVKSGLEALITLKSAKRLAKLGGTELKLKKVPRRQTKTSL